MYSWFVTRNAGYVLKQASRDAEHNVTIAFMTSHLLLVRTVLCAVIQLSQGQLCVHQTCDNVRFVLRLVRAVLCVDEQFSQGLFCVPKAYGRDSSVCNYIGLTRTYVCIKPPIRLGLYKMCA